MEIQKLANNFTFCTKEGDPAAFLKATPIWADEKEAKPYNELVFSARFKKVEAAKLTVACSTDFLITVNAIPINKNQDFSKDNQYVAHTYDIDSMPLGYNTYNLNFDELEKENTLLIYAKQGDKKDNNYLCAELTANEEILVATGENDFRVAHSLENDWREEYKDTLFELVAKRQELAVSGEATRIKSIIKNPEAARESFKQMLGWPLTEPTRPQPKAEKEFIEKRGNINIYRVQFTVLDGLKFFGLYYEQDTKEQLPLIIAQHGGAGTTELCSGVLGGSANYNGMVSELCKKGVHVFTPQLFLWENVPAEERAQIDPKLKQLGSSITAVEVYEIMQAIDYLSCLPNVDENRIGMVGMSYGGFYTLFTTAIDTRIKAAVASSQYNNRFEYSWSDWTWFNAGFSFRDNEVAALVYPRPLCLEIGDKDELFKAEFGQKEYERLSEIIGDANWPEFRVFDGNHEFYKGGEDLERLVQFLKTM